MKITFLPQNKIVEARQGEMLLDVCRREGISLGETCAGRGVCKKCKVLIDWEEKLACQVEVSPGMEVIFPHIESAREETKAKISIPQSGHNKEIGMDYAKSGYGVAFDLGTTTVVGSLVCLRDGEVVSTLTRTNPQRSVGADVISRIQYCEEKKGNTAKLQEKILTCMEEILRELQEKSGKERIKEISIVGNPTMTHILLGYSPSSLARYPFSHKFHGSVRKCADTLREAILSGNRKEGKMEVTILPNIGGQVGSDVTMGMLACRLPEKKGNYLFLDIGTNGEIACIMDGVCYVCSAAAGPVFEGGSISCGMRAAQGAVEQVEIQAEGEVLLNIIGKADARGCCGSGIIDTVAQLLKVGILKEDGYLLGREEARQKGISQKLCERIVSDGGERAFCLCKSPKPVFITQADIRQVQLAKGAIAAGIEILFEEVNLEKKSLDSVLVAGAFGNYLKKESAIEIGLFPDLPLSKIDMVGNAASIGAIDALLFEETKKTALELSQKVKVVELASYKNFQKIFLENLNFKRIS